ncbi:hypothetical protein TNCV_3891801 [Trichonephila clavipes]|nr:hypothetical protein TNCV_3891801 [Trichonephila clavipes]
MGPSDSWSKWDTTNHWFSRIQFNLVNASCSSRKANSTIPVPTLRYTTGIVVPWFLRADSGKKQFQMQLLLLVALDQSFN